MKTLNLESFGVNELAFEEKQSIIGGSVWKATLKVARAILEAVGAWVIIDEAYNGFVDGWNEAEAEAGGCTCPCCQ